MQVYEAQTPQLAPVLAAAASPGTDLPDMVPSGAVWLTWAALNHAAYGAHRGLLLLILLQVGQDQ